MQFHRGIRIDRIPVEGGGGLIFAAGIAVLVLLAMPSVVPLAIAAVLGGAALAPVLHRSYYY